MFDTLAQTTKEEALRIQTLPQHFNGTTTNPEWLKARTVVPGIKRITGSMVANCGHHAYKQKKKLPEACKEIALWSFLWDDFKGNDATLWKTESATCNHIVLLAITDRDKLR